MTKELLCTLGPSSLNDRVVARLEALGASLFRINLSHTRFEDLAGIIRYLQGRTKVPVCLDTEGAQIRTGSLVDGKVAIRENGLLRVHAEPVPGDSHDLNLYPEDVVDLLAVEDFLTVDFDSVLFQVIETHPGLATLRALSGGVIGSNKAVTLERDVDLPALTRKDRLALELGKELGLKHVALSFANRPPTPTKCAGSGRTPSSSPRSRAATASRTASASRSSPTHG